jgi:hypothetical protein
MSRHFAFNYEKLPKNGTPHSIQTTFIAEIALHYSKQLSGFKVVAMNYFYRHKFQ